MRVSEAESVMRSERLRASDGEWAIKSEEVESETCRVSAHLDDSGGELGPHVQGVVLHHVERHGAHHQHVLLVVEVHAAGEETQGQHTDTQSGSTHGHTLRVNTEQNTEGETGRDI